MKKIITLFIVVALLGCMEKNKPGQPTLAVVALQGGDTVRVAVGASFSATFMISNASDVYAVAALVKYDTTYLLAVKTADRIAEKGQFLGTTGDLTAAFVNGIPGSVVFAYSKQGANTGSNGEGDLWKISMMALKAGLTKISFEPSRCFVMSPRVIGTELERLPARFEDKFVKIEPEPIPGDTAVIYIKID